MYSTSVALGLARFFFREATIDSFETLLMDSFSFDANAAMQRSTQRSEHPVRSVGDTLVIEDVDRFRFQDGKFGPFLKFNIKVQGGEWLYCQTNWDDNGQAIVVYLMEQAFGKRLVNKSGSEKNFLSLLNNASVNGTFEITLKRRRVSENEGRQYTNWYVWINRDASPLEEDRRQRWIDADEERYGSKVTDGGISCDTFEDEQDLADRNAGDERGDGPDFTVLD